MKTRMERVHAALYAALICVLAASSALFLSQFLTSEVFWERFTIAYLGALVVYTWYLFALLLVLVVRPRRYPTYGGQKIAVLIPCYNEEPALDEESIRSVLCAYGNKQVIVVDDGSTNGVQTRLRELAQELPITLHEFAENAGKREALFHATTKMLDDDVAFVVTIDSDTLLAATALVRVVEPLLDPKIGASTGNVLLLNERQNLLTRMIVVVVTNPTPFFTAILPSWVALLLIRYIFVPLRAPHKLLGLFLYMFFYECCLYWLNLWALFTVRNKSWVTRMPAKASQPAVATARSS